jgi:uncharacterized membrane protein
MSLLGQMDRVVYATRLDRLLFMRVQPRTFRWTPLFLIAALLAGYFLMAKTGSSPNRSFLVGWLLFYAAYLAAAFLRIFGPRFVATNLAPLDERELMVKARAYAISGIALTSFAMLGCTYMAAADLMGFWRPQLPNDWISLALGIQAAAMLLPTFIASWLEPRRATDPEE